MRRLLLTVVAAAALAPGAYASQLVGRNATHVRLQVSREGAALVTYRSQASTRRVLAWGAVNARHPQRGMPQVRFRLDWTGGWATLGRKIWRRFPDACRPYDGPSLAWLVAACRAPDGTYWALQAWRLHLPHHGYPPWRPRQQSWELHLSHWSGPLARLEAWVDWVRNGEAQNVFGRLTYLGVPVHGFGTTRDGVPTDGYGRLLYLDTFRSAYGRGWKHETSIVTHRPSGTFCHGFYPTRDVALPGRAYRPAGSGRRYRITVAGPGVTPDVRWVGRGLGRFDPRDEADVAHEVAMNALLDELVAPQVAAGDASCAVH